MRWATRQHRLMKPRCGRGDGWWQKTNCRQLTPRRWRKFAAKLAVFPPESDAKADDVTPVLNAQSLAEKPPQVDKTVLVLAEPRRIRDRDHIRHVIKQPCLICGRRPSDPHHL